nr:carboxypeptidase C prc1 [Polyrhizophydium stewartii]
MSRAAASSDDGEAGVPLIIRASTVSQDSHCPGGSVPGTSPLAGADAVEKGGATPRGTSSAAPRASPLEVLERIEALVQTLRECRTLIAQDSVDPDYAMEPQWVERVQARVQALETELDERQDAGVARSLDQLPPAERTQRLLAWTDSLESAERRGYLRNTLGRIVLAVEGIPSSRVPPNVTELLATYTLERLADSPEDETLVLSDALVHTLDAAITQMDAHLEQLAQKLSSVTTEIVAFWEELRIDESLRTVLVADLRNLDDYCELCEALRLEWVAQMKAHVDEVVAYAFTAVRAPQLTNLAELRVLAVRLEKCHGINRLIEQRQDLLAKMHDFERTASDPRRLFRPSFQLVEEERFRKTCLPSLMKIEADIVDAVKHLEQETGEPFCEGDARYIDKLEAEIAQRFINATVFVLGRTSQPSRPTHWILAAKTITKGFSAVGRAVDSAHKPTPAPKTLARQKSLSRLRSTPSLKQGGQAPT